MATLEEICSSDESWDMARQLVHKHLSAASLTWRLIHNAWLGAIDEKEFVKLFCFTRLPTAGILRAANMPDDDKSSVENITQAVKTLGVPLASVVVGIQLSCYLALKQQPEPIWKKTCFEMMALVEIGYRFGSRVRELGPAAGALAGFGVGCGMLIALNENPTYLSEWLGKSPPRPSTLSIFGTEVSQISGFMLQHLGYGHEAAFGAAFGSGIYSKAALEFSSQSLTWIAACRWIESLRNSRNYPRDMVLRAAFPAIAPPAVGSGLRNTTLEVLYSEVAPVVRDGSQWSWHLPKHSYEETEVFLMEQS